jgi:hypothetical protein
VASVVVIVITGAIAVGVVKVASGPSVRPSLFVATIRK